MTWARLTGLTFLRVSYAGGGGGGPGVRDCLQGLSGLRELRVLECSGMDLAAGDLDAAPAGLTRLVAEFAATSGCTEPPPCTQVLRLPGLQELVVSWGAAGPSLLDLCGAPALTSLHLDPGSFLPRVLLRGLPCLRHLRVRAAVLDDGFLEQVGSLQSLRLLDVLVPADGARLVTDAGLAHLTQLRLLESASLGDLPGITAQGLRPLLRLPLLGRLWATGPPELLDSLPLLEAEKGLEMSLRVKSCVPIDESASIIFRLDHHLHL